MCDGTEAIEAIGLFGIEAESRGSCTTLAPIVVCRPIQREKKCHHKQLIFMLKHKKHVLLSIQT